jgi:spoIIIJ-associated protein
MPKFVEKEAKTIDEAIQLALEELNIDLEDAQVDILDEGSKAKLGIFGGKGAKVRVTVNIPDTKIVANFLDEIINRSRSEDDCPKYVITEEEEDGVSVIKVNISGNDVSHLIGRHGDSLYAINYLASILVNKGKEDYKRVYIDVEDYRKHREENLVAMANRAASRVAKYKRPVSLDPMPAYERRIIHSYLQTKEGVTTYSLGEGMDRHLVIEYEQTEEEARGFWD